MQITTLIEIEHGATYPYTAAQAAAQCIAALGGSAPKDTCVATIAPRDDRSVKWGMVFTVEVRLTGADRFQYDANGAATQLLAALAGNPTKDTCLTTVSMERTTGTAGLPYPPVAA